MKRRTFILATLVAVAALVCAPGCELTPEQRADYQTKIDKAHELRDATTQKVADLETFASQVRASATTLPVNDPVREAALKTARTIDETAAQYRKGLAALDRSIAVLQAGINGDLDSVGAALKDVPYVGPYAGLILLAAGLGKKWYDDAQKKKVIAGMANEIDLHTVENERLNGIATQLVKSVEKVLPEKTEDTKLKLAAEQDDDTKQFVNQVKAVG